MEVVACFACKKKTTFSDKVGFRAECDCGEDLHVCKTCRFYDPKAYNECRETSADVIRDKERSNLCDFFQPNGEQAAVDNSAALRAAAEALFKKPGGQ